MTDIQPVAHIVCWAASCRRVAADPGYDPAGETVFLTATHSDGTIHDVGRYANLDDSEAAAQAWKRRYLLTPA